MAEVITVIAAILGGVSGGLALPTLQWIKEKQRKRRRRRMRNAMPTFGRSGIIPARDWVPDTIDPKE